MDELAQARFVVAAVAALALLAWALSRRNQRLQESRFVALARAFGSEVDRRSEFLARFTVEVRGSEVEVRSQHLGGGIGSNSSGRSYVVIDVPLRGVSDLHSVDIRRRFWRGRVKEADAAAFEEHFTIFDAGFRPAQGWLSEPVRIAITRFFAAAPTRDALSIENARLVHRCSVAVRDLEEATLREMIERQVVVAEALVRAL